MKYRKKPVVIDAFQHKPGVYGREPRWLIDAVVAGTITANMEDGKDYAVTTIHTLEGDMRVDPDDWIIRGVKGEFYPCKPEIFEATYDRA